MIFGEPLRSRDALARQSTSASAIVACMSTETIRATESGGVAHLDRALPIVRMVILGVLFVGSAALAVFVAGLSLATRGLANRA